MSRENELDIVKPNLAILHIEQGTTDKADNRAGSTSQTELGAFGRERQELDHESGWFEICRSRP
jgi:hypothetical protein